MPTIDETFKHLTDQQLGAKIGCSQQHANRIRRGLVEASPKLAAAMVKLAAGKLSFDDIYGAKAEPDPAPRSAADAEMQDLVRSRVIAPTARHR